MTTLSSEEAARHWKPSNIDTHTTSYDSSNVSIVKKSALQPSGPQVMQDVEVRQIVRFKVSPD